jgi:hypothetical protein
VSALVPGVFSLGCGGVGELDAHRKQEFTSLGGETGRQLVVSADSPVATLLPACHFFASIMSMTC